MATNNSRHDFIAKIYPAAIQASKETGMSWELILAQAALETGWGEKTLPGTNNLFNIKADKSWQGESKVFRVWEMKGKEKVWQNDAFRVYKDYTEAFTDRAHFLQKNPRYEKAGLFDESVKGNMEAEARALQKAGYATDPQYAEKLVEIFNGKTMQQALKYAQERHQFGTAIANFQAINFKLAEMITEIEASELLIRKASYLKNHKKPMTTEGAMAKYYASEACVKISNEAVQIFGGYGYTKDFPVEKFYRDSKLCTIGEGTTEIQKLVIGRNILKD